MLTREELINDFEQVYYIDNSEKLILSQKYNTSKKIKDIQNVILIFLREERKTRQSFDSKDITNFLRFDFPDKKLIEYLKEENIEFVNYYKQFLFNKLKEKNLHKYIESKNLSGLSPSNKYFIKRYRVINDYVKNICPTSEEINEKQLKETLKTKISLNLIDFKNQMLNQTKIYTEKKYERLIQNLKECNNKLQQFIVTQENYTKYSKLQKKIQKINNIFIKHPTIESYINYEIEQFERDFNDNIDLIVERVFNKQFDINKIECSEVNEEYGKINVILDDGNKKLYCRAILAAEYSTLMIPHIRFIITEK